MIEETNVTIAKLILHQTYAERIELAQFLADVSSGDPAEPITGDDFARWLETWADQTLEAVE